MYTNVANTRNVLASNVIAGTRKLTLGTQFKPAGTQISATAAGPGTVFNSAGNFDTITYKWVDSTGKSSNTAAPQALAANISLRKISSTGVTSRVFYTLPVGVANGIFTQASTITISTGDTFYWDVISAGTLAGRGLVVTADYYLY